MPGIMWGIPSRVYGQIGTNPANPYGGAPSQNQGYNGSVNNPNNPNNPNRIKQDSGTLKSVFYSRSVKLINENSLLKDSLTLSALDTTLTGFENYSVLYQPDRYYLNLGNLGLAATPLFPEFGRPTGFSPGQRSFSVYTLQPEDIQYYRNKSPYTDVFYVTGKGQKSGFAEGLFRFVHARNINSRLNVGISYARIGSNGYYPRQTTDVLNASVFAWYQSRNLRYNFISNLIVNTVNAEENGGLRNDSLSVIGNHQYQPVYLSGAGTKWNDYSLYLRQYYLVGRIDSVRDPVTKQIKVYPTARGYYVFHYKNSTYNYNDNFRQSNQGQGFGTSPGLYYPNIFLDTLRTADRIVLSRLENELGLSIFGRGSATDSRSFSASGIRLDASLKDDLVHYRQDRRVDTTINNIILAANAGYDLSNRFNIRLDGSYVLVGPNHFDTYLAANAFLSLGESLGQLTFKASLQSNLPEFVFDRYESNSYSWRFHFARDKVKKLSALYSSKPLDLTIGAEYNLLNNYHYFAGIANQVVFPSQYPGEITILRAFVDKELRFGKFGFRTHLVYQRNNAPFVVRSPDYYAYASIYATNTYFKVLRIKLGVDGTWFSKTYALDYAPGLQQFFVYSNQQIGDYPVGNVFLLATLKRTNFIFRYDYANQGFPKSGYFTVHNYPMPDHLFKFGLSWKFYD